jgi:hypothetical protein
MLKVSAKYFIAIWLFALSAQASYISENMQEVFAGTDQGVQIHVYETMNRADFYLPSTGEIAAVTALQKEVSARTDVDPYFLLKKQKEIFKKVGFAKLLPRFDLALAQKISEISFLEEILFELHSEKIQKSLFVSYSEFAANILLGPKGELAILFISNSQDASVPDTELRRKVLKEYLAKGYRYQIHIHNHPFNFNNPDDMGGTTIPSGDAHWGDVGVYLLEKQKYQLENAWITNGFSSLHIKAADFSKY